MSSGAVVCWVALLLWLAAPPALPFNLETRLPLVKYGADGVYFGFSVAEHQTVNYITNASTVGDSWSVFFYLFLYCLLLLFCCCVRLCQLYSRQASTSADANYRAGASAFISVVIAKCHLSYLSWCSANNFI